MERILVVTILAFMTSQFIAEESPPAEPHVGVNGSDVYGVTLSLDHSEYWAFLGIRYGKAPVENLRFSKTKLEPLPSVINASAFGAHCHPILSDPKADEDCLFLNIYTPVNTTAASSKRPVIFYIHGGGNVMGNPESKPDGGPLVINGDVIVVTINYRLGPLGFLYTGMDDGVSGNMGFWDQNLALTWVTRYIEYFGGDPNMITLIGESAGGKAVSIHTVSPYSKHMVRRAVMESGTIYGPTLYAWDAPEMARRLASPMCDNRTPGQPLVECLRQIPAANLSVKGALMWPDSAVWTILDFGWGAVIDGDFIPFLDHIAGAFQGEVMMGVNNNEGTLLADWRFPLLDYIPMGAKAKEELLSCDGYKSVMLNETLHQYFGKGTSCSALNSVYDFYVNCGDDGTVPLKEAMTIYGDSQYLAPAVQYLQKEVTTSNAYFYFFDHNVPRHEGNVEAFRGSHHAEDQPYIMGAPDVNGYTSEVAEKERNLSKVLMTYLINFAKTGNPNLPHQVPIPFPKYEPKGGQNYLHINDAILEKERAATLQASGFLLERMSLWLEKLPFLMQTTAICDGAVGSAALTWTVLTVPLLFVTL